MSEKLHAEHEQFEKLKDSDFEKLEKKASENHEKAAAQAPEKSSEIDTILKKIEKEAISGKELSKHHTQETGRQDIDNYSHHQLSSETFNQTIKRAQAKLPVPMRTFSKFVHNSKVETVSDIAGSTIARPSALLWGGLFSMLASIGVLILCRYYGYEYNFTVGLISFAGGYCLGLIVELIFRRR